MATFNVAVMKVITNGPYSYTLVKDGVGQKTVNNLTTVAAAMNGIRDDIGALLAGESVERINIIAQSG